MIQGQGNAFNNLDFGSSEQIHKMMRAHMEAKEQLVRDHFSDTPLALASIVRTGIMPWNVQIQTRRAEPEFGDDVDSVTIRMREYVRVVEYPRSTMPGLW